ncbi:hypothetical protein LV478_15335 [Komagataeibacter oboediens]|uniref:hypothetical protein n=1 Tax=Komagataeibacter oboediens TaxID=65958 RepID=UPI0023DA08AA|nr:hypothetical protein [Komagataeibacter oboediens]WEQ51863.1 hypothetical protein LV478_15335 [Komagataeibacter oboediens]
MAGCLHDFMPLSMQQEKQPSSPAPMAKGRYYRINSAIIDLDWRHALACPDAIFTDQAGIRP